MCSPPSIFFVKAFKSGTLLSWLSRSVAPPISIVRSHSLALSLSLSLLLCELVIHPPCESGRAENLRSAVPVTLDHFFPFSLSFSLSLSLSLSLSFSLPFCVGCCLCPLLLLLLWSSAAALFCTSLSCWVDSATWETLPGRLHTPTEVRLFWCTNPLREG